MKSLKQITDEDCLKATELLCGVSHLSEDSRIAQVKEQLTTNKLYNGVTNIPGIAWYKTFKYLEEKGYTIE